MMEKKTAVYCRTIEEYNIVAKHYGRKYKECFTEYGWQCIKTDVPDGSHSFGGDNSYTDIPFNYWILTEMPKIGDKVIITKSDRSWAKPMDKYDGKIVIVTVTSPHEKSHIRFDDDDDWVWDFSKGHFRIATPEEISNYENKNQPESIYVKITNSGVMYTTHSKAEEYGCTNYDYRGSLSNGTVCRVIATPYINNTCDGYVLEYANKHYLIEQSGTIPATKEEYDAQFKEKDSCLFVKGQWYKLYFNRYMKFSHLENRGDYNKLYYTESICNGQYESVNDFLANISMEKYALEYPLEKVMDEIQPYLPEGHEDKVVKVSSKEPVYIAGKWYKMNNCWYAKCSKNSFDAETFYGNERYDSGGKHYDGEFPTTLEKQNSIVELTESIIDHKTPIELKIIICGDMKDGTKPEPKYKVGDELESCKGGWQYIETGLELKNATSHVSSGRSIIKGKCTKVEWSNTHQIWWYKIGDYGNMFTESAVKLVDKMKSIEPEYSKYTIKLNSQEEYGQCLDYFENILKISNVNRNLGFTPNWNKFKYDESRKLWRLHGYEDTMEYIVSFQDFINNITKIPYKLIPKFSKGDKVKICSSEEDISRDGFMNPYKSVEKIYGLADYTIILTGEIEEKNGNIYYGYGDSGAYIKESCLSLVKKETILKDSFVNSTDEDEITEYKGLKEEDYYQKTLNLLKKQITII